MIADGHPWLREPGEAEWRLLELPTGHWTMFSRPEDLVEVLLGLELSVVDGGANSRR